LCIADIDRIGNRNRYCSRRALKEYASTPITLSSGHEAFRLVAARQNQPMSLSTPATPFALTHPQRRRDDHLHVVRPTAPYNGPERRTHLFVHTVRFWSMAAIIAIHCVPEAAAVKGISLRWLQLCVDPFKFGTIAFFLISGFLMGERLVTSHPLDYFLRRVRTIAAPWTVWLILRVSLKVLADAHYHRASLSTHYAVMEVALRDLVFCFRRTPFWFVPNLLIGTACLLIFRRRLHDLRFGAVLLAINLFYTANIYLRWLPNSHTDATFGFVFYLWLGAWATRHIRRLQEALARVPMPLHILIASIACVFSAMESHHMQSLPGVDPLNTLRLTNQVFSVMMVLLMLRVRRSTWPRFVDVPANTFGLYLTHPLCQAVFFYAAHYMLAVRTTYLDYVALWTVLFVLVYGSSLLLTRSIASITRFRWLVGAKPAPERRAADPAVAASPLPFHIQAAS
jgi:peptidoglycan/LPS O-acetylase OafA/YrhL